MHGVVDDEKYYADDYAFKREVFCMGVTHGREVKDKYSKMRSPKATIEYTHESIHDELHGRTEYEWPSYTASPFDPPERGKVKTTYYADQYDYDAPHVEERSPVLDKLEEAMRLEREAKRMAEEFVTVRDAMNKGTGAMTGLAEKARLFNETLRDAKRMDTPTPVKVKKEYQKSYDKRTSVENYDRIVKALSEVNHMAVLVSDNANVCSLPVRYGSSKLEADKEYRLGPIKVNSRAELYVQVYDHTGHELPLLPLDNALDAFEGWGEFMREELENTGLFASFAELRAHCQIVGGEGTALLNAMSDDIQEGIGEAMAHKAAAKANAELQQLEQQAHYGTL